MSMENSVATVVVLPCLGRRQAPFLCGNLSGRPRAAESFENLHFALDDAIARIGTAIAKGREDQGSVSCKRPTRDILM
jgi:hypothetical protein